jgi:RHS repeat-associated protein
MITSSESSPDNAYAYGYDRFGNRWSQTLTEGEGYNSSVTFDANNHITSGSVGTDIAGNVDIADTGSGYADTFIYFADNNIDYVYGNGAYQAYYHYDGLGRRTEKIAGSSTNYYYYDLAGHEVAVMDQNGNWIRGEVYAGGKHIATYVGGATGATYFDHAAHLGTERVRTDMTGSVCGTMASLPFGDWYNTTGTCPGITPLHFTGKERDTESNLDNFGARYYSNTFGRWMSPDPGKISAPHLANPQKWNEYAYVLNNPLALFDPDGRQEMTIVYRTFIAPQSMSFMGNAYAGDHRGFTTAPNASSRSTITVRIETDPSIRPGNPIISQTSSAGQSRELDANGNTIKSATATSGLPTAAGTRDANGNAVINITQDVKNPLSPVPQFMTPGIGANLNVTASPNGSTVSATGTASNFPSEELHVTGANGTTTPVFQFTPSQGSSPFSLFLPDRKVDSTVNTSSAQSGSSQ